MAKVGHIVISGLAWIAIAGTIGFLGWRATRWGGFWAFGGWTIVVVAALFIWMSISHLTKLVSLSLKTLKMMEEQPEQFAQLNSEFDRIMQEKKPKA